MNRNNANNRQRQLAVVLPEPAQVGALVVQGVTQFTRRHPYISTSYLMGWLLIVLSITTVSQLTVAQQTEYNAIMDTVNIQAEYDASQHYWRDKQAYAGAKGWFSCDSSCQRLKTRMNTSHTTLQAIRREGRARMSDAAAVAGMWSTVGMDELKDSFWGYFQQGKQFAKRQTGWDIMFMGMRSMTRGRDESWIEFGLKVLLQVLLNFSMGLCMAFIMFVIGLWAIVKSYQPNPFMAVVFFLAAATAAFSFVATYLMAVYGAAAASVYGVLKLAETSARAQLANGGGGGQGQQRVGYNRPHND